MKNQENAVVTPICHSRKFLSGIFNACRCKNVVMLNSFQHLHLNQTLSKEEESLNKGFFRAPLRSGFTLIELLVVVLIIGILAAVAVPQYQKAVYKSRFATLKNLTKSVVVAQELYYLANGQYATKFEELDIDMPGGKKNNSTVNMYYYEWGYCYITTGHVAQAACHNADIGMEYQQRFVHSEAEAGNRSCIAFSSDQSDPRSQICQAETQHITPDDNGGTWLGWLYL